MLEHYLDYQLLREKFNLNVQHLVTITSVMKFNVRSLEMEHIIKFLGMAEQKSNKN